MSASTDFTTDYGTIRAFLEGAEMVTYAWNSAPVVGTDLSCSLLASGREFHFPIDYTCCHHITFNIDKDDVKSFEDQLVPLLHKSSEIYKLLIHEHRATHREYRNAQLNNPKKYNLHDIVFTNVQVQSKALKYKVRKLSYIKRCPYKIIKCYQSGSYDLQSLKTGSVVRKHRSDLYLSPKTIQPIQPLESSDTIYGSLNKKMVSDPYETIHIQNYVPIQPWKNVSALMVSTQLLSASVLLVEPFSFSC